MTDLVIGGRGNLGRHLMTDLPAAVSTSRDGDSDGALNILNENRVRDLVTRLRPRCVINTAAMTSVDGCERDPEAAQAVHVEGTENLVRACECAGARLIHLSTNYVFDGEDGPYTESDETNPLSVYGRTKLESERIVLDGRVNGLVVRTAVFYGPEFDRPNFVTWAIRQLILGQQIRIVTDETATPTYVPELSRAIAAFAGTTDMPSLVHVAGFDFASRYQMIETVCDVFGLNKDLVKPVGSSELGQDAPRPSSAGLTTDLARTLLDYEFRPLRANLIELKQQIGNPEAWALSD